MPSCDERCEDYDGDARHVIAISLYQTFALYNFTGNVCVCVRGVFMGVFVSVCVWLCYVCTGTDVHARSRIDVFSFVITVIKKV